MIDEDWRGFVSAFNQAVRPSDTSGRAGKRVLVIGLAVVLVLALGALLDGAFGGGTAVAKPGDVKPITSSAATGSGSLQTGSSWTAVAGPTCLPDATSGFTAYGYYTGTNSDQTTGWSTSPNGGYSGGSCTGGYLSIPVSGQSSLYDSTRFALWKFDFSSTFTSASCKLSTYIPDSPKREVVGGDPAYYYYYQTDYEYGSTDTALGVAKRVVADHSAPLTSPCRLPPDLLTRAPQSRWTRSPTSCVHSSTLFMSLCMAESR